MNFVIFYNIIVNATITFIISNEIVRMIFNNIKSYFL